MSALVLDWLEPEEVRALATLGRPVDCDPAELLKRPGFRLWAETMAVERAAASYQEDDPDLPRLRAVERAIIRLGVENRNGNPLNYEAHRSRLYNLQGMGADRAA